MIYQGYIHVTKNIVRFTVCESRETMVVIKKYESVETLGGDLAMTFRFDNQAAMNYWGVKDICWLSHSNFFSTCHSF